MTAQSQAAPSPATTPTVYIVHEPLKRGPNGEMVPAVDLRPAGNYGNIHVIMPGRNRPAKNPATILPILHEALEHFQPEDFLVIAGDLHLIVWAAGIALYHTGGTLNLLRWDHTEQGYVPLSANLWPELTI